MYKHLENKMCKELEALEEKYRTAAELAEGDLRRIDLLAHSLKSLATYSAMKEAEEQQRMGNNSYAGNSYAGNSYAGNSYGNNSYMNNSYMGNSNNMGRFMSRDMMPGQYPMYPEERRW